MTRATLWAPVAGRLLVGAVLGVCLVVFGVFAGLFTRDLILSGQTCTALAGAGPAAPILFEACMARVQAAAGRLWWEISALVAAGGLIGALARQRQARGSESPPGEPPTPLRPGRLITLEDD